MSALAMELRRDHRCVGRGIMYTCGSCSSLFDTLCHLSNHFEEDHLGSTTFVYDRNTRTAFPKYDFSCKASQTDTISPSKELLPISEKVEADVPVCDASQSSENKQLQKSELTDAVLNEFTVDTNVIEVISEESVALFKVLYKTGEDRALVMGDPLMLLTRLINEQPSDGDPDEIQGEQKILVAGTMNKPEDDIQSECIADTTSTDTTSKRTPKVEVDNTIIEDNALHENALEFSSINSGHVIVDTKMEFESSEEAVPKKRKKMIPEDPSPSKRLESMTEEVHVRMTEEVLDQVDHNSSKSEMQQIVELISETRVNVPAIVIDTEAIKLEKEDGTEFTDDFTQFPPAKKTQRKVGRPKKERKISIVKGDGDCSMETMVTEKVDRGENDEEPCKHCWQSHPGQVWTCTACQKGFVCDKKYLAHINLQMFQKLEKNGVEVEKCEVCKSPLCPTEPNVCCFCGSTFTCRTRLHKHEKHHYKSFPCNICNKAFSTKSAVKTHMFVHEPKNSGNAKFKCKICDAEYPVQNRLDHHTRNVHMGEKNATCDECGKQFFNAAGLAAHAKVHGEPQLLCNLCPKAFRNPSNLKKHLDSHNEDNHCACSVCGKKFLSQLNLDLHFRNVHSGEKRYECGECHARFFKHSGLKSHIFTHHSNMLYICEVCTKAFKDPYLYNKHLEIHNDNISLDCSMCQKTFSNEHNLKKHIAVIHTKAKDFECEICHNKFARSDYLHRHMKSHFEGTFQCSNCTKLCKSRYELKQHMRSHDENTTKNFHCAICNKHFAHASSLGRHMKQCHNVEVEVAQFLVQDDAVSHAGTILVQDGQIQFSSALLLDTPVS